MSEPDKYDEQAKGLVDHCRFCDRLNDNYKCTHDYAASVLAIAAALREQGAEIAQLKAQLTEAEKRGMERAMGIACAAAHDQRTRIHEAICAAMEKL